MGEEKPYEAACSFHLHCFRLYVGKADVDIQFLQEQMINSMCLSNSHLAGMALTNCLSPPSYKKTMISSLPARLDTSNQLP